MNILWAPLWSPIAFFSETNLASAVGNPAVAKVKNRVYQLPNINAQLREYQIEGFKWLLSNYELGFGSILADDMGLGKTIQLITFLSYIYNNLELSNFVYAYFTSF